MTTPKELYAKTESIRKQSGDDEWRIINTIRTLSIDMVQAANSGHPGAPLGCAPMAYVLFSKFMKFNPKNPKWINRDRFVLSNGHACALQYSILHLYGYDLPMEELKKFRQLGSKTPGHPEVGHTHGIEVSTGPLGQGISNAVGLAMAEKNLAANFNKPGFEVINNFTYVICGDGCLQEGVASEAASLAGHLGLGNLIVLYDDNNITIDGSTDLSFTEDVLKRFESYGWHTDIVSDGDNDLKAIERAVENAKKVTDKPSIIKVKTTIGFGSQLQGTEKVHGAPLGPAQVSAVKELLGFDPQKSFHVEDDVKASLSKFVTNGQKYEDEHNELFKKYSEQFPELASDFKRRVEGKLPEGWKNALPRYTPQDKASGTRNSSEQVLHKLAAVLPELIGGSADLTHSNLTLIGQDFQKNTPQNRYIRFGVREHAMAAICNGLFAYGGFRPFCATFLNFIGYAQGAYRLSALSHFGVLYVMTHDSIGLGEDGPTHQPIESLASVRATPNIYTMRPADANEVAGCYAVAIETRTVPSVIALSRQALPVLNGSSIENTARGGYVLQDVDSPQVILVSTGSEVSICVDTAKTLAEKGIKARIVSMPICELFDEQSQEYKQSVFPKGIPSVSVEAASPFGWQKYAHESIGVSTFGHSAPFKDVYKKVGIVPEVIAEKVVKVVEYYSKNTPQELFRSVF